MYYYTSMPSKSTIPNWYRALQTWLQKPCPVDEWLYRGQSARYEMVIPLALRPQSRSLYRLPLHDIDYSIAERIFSSSPVFGGNGVFPHQITDPLGRRLADFSYAISGPPTYDPRLSFPEIVRALAQHYDYPTLFIDVSFDPLVAAMFATHRHTPSGYVVDEQEPSVLFRWPVQRSSAARLTISGQVNGSTEDMNVIDISRMMRFMRRPAQQRAALATPVFDPRPVYQPFSSTVDHLRFTDMARFSTCERFVLPPGAGHQLVSEDGISMDALFPDRIDLGYSYFALIALLSLIVHQPADDSTRKHELQEMYEAAIGAARAVLDRECLRLVENCPVPDSFHRHTLLDASRILESQIGTATKAISMLDAEEVRSVGTAAIRTKQDRIRAEAQRRFDAWVKAVSEVIGPDRAAQLAAQGVPEYTVSRRDDSAWVLPELNRRRATVDSIVRFAERCPVYALEDRARFRRIIDAFDHPADYEQEVLNQLAASKRWLAR